MNKELHKNSLAVIEEAIAILDIITMGMIPIKNEVSETLDHLRSTRADLQAEVNNGHQAN